MLTIINEMSNQIAAQVEAMPEQRQEMELEQVQPLEAVWTMQEVPVVLALRRTQPELAKKL